MKRRKRNSLFRKLISCWHDIAISDKALIIIMIILLIQCVINLFTVEPTSTNSVSITVIVRTTVAAIFGYFLSENFMKQEIIKSTADKNNVDNNIEHESIKVKTENSDEKNKDIESLEAELEDKASLKDFICNKSFQVIVALTVCVVCLLSLIIGHDFNLIPQETSPTVIQFRDLISSCVGFLLGHTSHIKSKNN